MPRNTVSAIIGCCVLILGPAACSSDDSGPPTGSEGGPCYGNDTCDDGLVCLSDLCVRLSDADADADVAPEAETGADADADADVAPEAETGADADADVDVEVDADAEADSFSCTPDTYYCDSTTVSAHCNTAGTGADGSWNCEAIYGTTCNSATGECFRCVADTYYCDSTTVSAHCNTAGTGADGSWNCEAIYGTTCNPTTGRCIVS